MVPLLSRLKDLTIRPSPLYRFKGGGQRFSSGSDTKHPSTLVAGRKCTSVGLGKHITVLPSRQAHRGCSCATLQSRPTLSSSNTSSCPYAIIAIIAGTYRDLLSRFRWRRTGSASIGWIHLMAQVKAAVLRVSSSCAGHPTCSIVATQSSNSKQQQASSSKTSKRKALLPVYIVTRCWRQPQQVCMSELSQRLHLPASILCCGIVVPRKKA